MPSIGQDLGQGVAIAVDFFFFHNHLLKTFQCIAAVSIEIKSSHTT